MSFQHCFGEIVENADPPTGFDALKRISLPRRFASILAPAKTGRPSTDLVCALHGVGHERCPEHEFHRFAHLVVAAHQGQGQMDVAGPDQGLGALNGLERKERNEK